MYSTILHTLLTLAHTYEMLSPNIPYYVSQDTSWKIFEIEKDQNFWAYSIIELYTSSSKHTPLLSYNLDEEPRLISKQLCSINTENADFNSFYNKKSYHSLIFNPR